MIGPPFAEEETGVKQRSHRRQTVAASGGGLRPAPMGELRSLSLAEGSRPVRCCTARTKSRSQRASEAAGKAMQLRAESSLRVKTGGQDQRAGPELESNQRPGVLWKQDLSHSPAHLNLAPGPFSPDPPQTFPKQLPPVSPVTETRAGPVGSVDALWCWLLSSL